MAGRDVYDPYKDWGRFGGLSRLSERIHTGPPDQPSRAANGQQTSGIAFAQLCEIRSQEPANAA
jgi:hypothetical protein